jgi:hypothetical protein
VSPDHFPDVPRVPAADAAHGTATRRSRHLARWLERPPIGTSMVLVFAVLYLRGLAIVHDPQPIWDDKNFIGEGILYGGPASWFRPYAGYILVVPRMLSDWLTIFNLLEAPWWGMVISFIGMAWAFCLILSRGFDYLLPLRWRVAVACAATLLPWFTEVYASLPSIQWTLYAVLALFSIAHYDAMSKPAKAALPVATALIIFSTANAVWTFPVFAARVLAGARARRSYAFGYALFASTLIVVYAVMVVTYASRAPSSWPGRIDFSDRPDLVTFLHFVVKGIGFKIVALSLAGERIAMRALAFPAAYFAAFLAWAALTVSAILLAIRRRQEAVPFALAAVAYYTAATVVFSGLFRNEYVVAHFIRDGQYFGADRYFLPSSLFFYLSVAWVLDALDRIPARTVVRTIAAIGFAVAAVINFEYPPRPDNHWRHGVLHYYQALLATHGRSPTPSEFRIVVHPPAYEWNLVLPLYELRAEDRRRIQAIVARERAR